MKLALLSLTVTALSLASAATTPAPTPKLAPDCTQAQRQTINKLLQQDVNPAKACYAAAKGDITTLSTSRLCPLDACRDWLAVMAEKTPDCIYDVTNYGRDFRSKNKDCANPEGAGASGSADTDATPTPTLGSGTGSGSEAGVTTPAPTTRKPTTAPPVVSESSSSSSGETDIEPIETPQPDEVTFPPETTAPTPTTRAVTPASAAPSALTTGCVAAALSVAVAATLAL